MQTNVTKFFKRRATADISEDFNGSSGKRQSTESEVYAKEDNGGIRLDDSASDTGSSDTDTSEIAGSPCSMSVSVMPTAVPILQGYARKPPGPDDISSGRAEGPTQPSRIIFPSKRFGTKQRAFRPAWYSSHKWLEYSVSQDAAYCFCCRMFPSPHKPTSENTFTSTGFRQWKKATAKDAGFSQHERSDYHTTSFCAWKEFQQRLISGKTIDATISSLHEKTINENRHYVKQVAKVLCLTARQKIAQRGHKEDVNSPNKGNFLEILELLSEQDDIVKRRLEGKSRVKYTSPKIQNEILALLAQIIRKEITNELYASVNFSLIVDESKDISKKEQLSVVVRYLFSNSIHEEFLDFIQLHKLDAASLKDKLAEILKSCEIDPNNCVGQTYDGASVMSGVNRGVQELVRKELAPQALYIHCYNHRLNLVIVDSVKSVQLADSFFSLLQEIYKFMSSHTAHEIYLAIQKKLWPAKQLRYLKSLSDTRWSCQYASCKVLLDTFPAVINTLEEIADSHTGKRAHDAASILMNISFTTILCLVMFTHILHKTKLVSDMLQSPSLDLSAAANLIDTVQQDLQNERSEEAWHNIWERGVEMSQAPEVEVLSPPKSRVRRIPKRLESSVVIQPVGHTESCEHEENYRNVRHYPVMDRLSAEIGSRFDSTNKSILHSISVLDPGSVNFLQLNQLDTLATQFNIDKDFLEIALRQAKRLVTYKKL